MKKVATVMALVLVLVTLAICGCSGDVSAPDDSPITIQWTYPPPAGQTGDIEANIVKDDVSEKTDSKVIFDLYPGSGLGAEKIALEGVLSGTIDMVCTSPNVAATVFPELNSRCLPYLFDDVDHFWRVIGTDEYKDSVNKIVNKKGLYYLGNICSTPRCINTVSKPIYTPEDASGCKIRVMDGTIYTDLYTTWGFSTSVISFGETYTAMQQGVVDGVDVDVNGAVFMKFAEVGKYLTETNHVIHGTMAFINMDKWNTLSDENKEIVQQSFREAELESKRIFEEEYAENRPLLESDFGVTVIELNDEQKAQWKTASEPIYKKYKDIIGAEYYDWFIDFVDSKR